MVLEPFLFPREPHYPTVLSPHFPAVGKGLVDWPSDRHYPAVGMLAADPADVLARTQRQQPQPLYVFQGPHPAHPLGSQEARWSCGRTDTENPFTLFFLMYIESLDSFLLVTFISGDEKTQLGKKEPEHVC